MARRSARRAAHLLIGLRKTWQELKRGQPGRRFQSRYERRASSAGARKWALVAAGVTLMLLGVIFLPLPGPGLLIIAAGALLVAEESLGAARALDWLELKARRLKRG